MLCLDVSAGIGIIRPASPMLQETFGGRLFGDPSVGFGQFNDAQKAQAALVGAAFVGLFSLSVQHRRTFWASLSDKIGRKLTYFTFFTLGFLCYAAAPTLATLGMLGLFAAAFCIIASMYGGGFATIPAYLADIFGTQYVGAIHGRLLTAWSTAGIVGPVIVNYLHDTRKAAGVPDDQIYHPIFYVLAGVLDRRLHCQSADQAVGQEVVHERGGGGGATGQAEEQGRGRDLRHWQRRLRYQGPARLGRCGYPARLGHLDHLAKSPGALHLAGDRPSEGEDTTLRQTVLLVALLNLAYFGVEFAVAIAIGSVSLFADSVDFLEDASLNLLIATALGWTALNRARLGTALAAILLIPVLATLWTAWQKFATPVPPAPSGPLAHRRRRACRQLCLRLAMGPVPPS